MLFFVRAARWQNLSQIFTSKGILSHPKFGFWHYFQHLIERLSYNLLPERRWIFSYLMATKCLRPPAESYVYSERSWLQEKASQDETLPHRAAKQLHSTTIAKDSQRQDNMWCHWTFIAASELKIRAKCPPRCPRCFTAGFAEVLVSIFALRTY